MLFGTGAMIVALVRIPRDMNSDDQRARELDVEPEKLAAYHTMVANYATIYDQAFLRDVVHEVVLNSLLDYLMRTAR